MICVQMFMLRPPGFAFKHFWYAASIPVGRSTVTRLLPSHAGTQHAGLSSATPNVLAAAALVFN
jgi:hypothetical protein